MSAEKFKRAFTALSIFIAFASGIRLSAETTEANITREMVCGDWEWEYAYSHQPSDTQDQTAEGEEDIGFTMQSKGTSVFAKNGKLRERYTLILKLESDEDSVSPEYRFVDDASWEYDPSNHTLQISVISRQVTPVNEAAISLSQASPELEEWLSDCEDETETARILSISEGKMKIHYNGMDTGMTYFRSGYVEPSFTSTTIQVLLILSAIALVASILVAFAKPEAKERTVDELREISGRQRNLVWITILSLIGIPLIFLYPVVVILQIFALYKLGKTINVPHLGFRCLLSIFPLVPIVNAFVFFAYVHRTYKKNGIRTGLFGARSEDVKYLERTGEKIDISQKDRCPSCGTPLVEKSKKHNKGLKIVIDLLLVIAAIGLIVAHPDVRTGAVVLGAFVLRFVLYKLLGQTKQWKCPHCGFENEHT